MLTTCSEPGGVIIHSVGFDDDNNVFRIFDVWESREQADRLLERVMAIFGDELPAGAAPPTRQGFYDLHDMAKP